MNKLEKTGLKKELVEQIVKVILKHDKPKRIVLFGSRARGDFSPVSDIDLAVEGVKSATLIKEVLDEEVDTLLKFDVVDLSKVPDYLREEIEKEGIVLYEERKEI